MKSEALIINSLVKLRDLEQLELLSAMRSLLLPLDAEQEEQGLACITDTLSGSGVPASDYASSVRLAHSYWRENGEVNEVLRSIVTSVLALHSPEFGNGLVEQYFRLHIDLLQRHYFSHDEASILLSHIVLMLRLHLQEHMSAAQIARVLSARDTRLRVQWRIIQEILAKVVRQPRLHADAVQRLVENDKRLEEITLADASVSVAVDLVSLTARLLGFPGELSPLLQAIANGPLPFAPYLQILHYQCLIAEFYDHALTNAYEFSPRGSIANWLIGQYPATLRGAGNPFLNNAKAVQNLDLAWAEGRDDHLPEARALSKILSGMENMNFAAKRELACSIRYLIHRLMRLHKPLEHILPIRPDVGSVEAILRSMSSAPSATRGIIEQRIIDALLSIKYQAMQDWRPRGLGDSVNATNVSSKKLGDCDFQSTINLTIDAYEAHAGPLTQIYLNEHCRTLEKAIRRRSEELLGIAELDRWRVNVTFVAHRFDAFLPEPFEVDGVHVTTEFIEMNVFITNILGTVERNVLLDAFQKYVHQPLNERRTPDTVRRAYSSLANVE